MKVRLLKSLLVSSGTILLALTAVLPARADYSNTVMSFNPVMYYHLNETTAIPPGDVATNSGTLGSVAQGYYLDGAVHPTAGIPGGGGDAAVNLTNGNGGWGGYARVKVPYLPQLNSNAAFSVEFWAMPAITTAIACPAASADFNISPRKGWLFYQGDSALATGNGWNFRVCRPDAAKTIAVNLTLDTTQWYHVVGVYDGTNVNLYVNGALAATAALGGTGDNATYAPNTNTTIGLTFGARADGNSGNYGWGGNLGEPAYYGAALSAAQVQAHYQAGTNPTPPTAYNQVVRADAPLGYWRLNEPSFSLDPSTLPVATNNGSFASAADGAYWPGVVDGQTGVPYTGFTANNHAPYFNSTAGSISIPGQTLVTDTFTITGWLKREGTQILGALLFQRDASGNLATGLQIWDESANNELRGNWDNGDYTIATGLTPPEGIWTFAAMVVTPTDTVIYMDDQSVSLAAKNGSALSHNAHDFSIGDFLIGQDSYNIAFGNPNGPPERIFRGLIDEVAVFDTALTPAQINQIYHAANVPPVILTQPQAASVNMGAPVNLSVLATGSPTLKYQWTKNGTNFVGKTTSTLAFPSTTVADNGSYAVIVTNNFGAVTSSVAVLTVIPVPAAFLRAVGYPAYDPVTQSGSLTQVILEFSAPLDLSAIVNPANYVVMDGSTRLAVTGAAFTNLDQTVLLTTAPQAQARLYTVTLSNIVDATGGTISSPTNTAQFRAWVASPLNGVRFEYYPCEISYLYTDNTRVALLTNFSLFPDFPVLATNLWAFDSRVIFPDDTHDNYGARMRGVFVPPSSGKWRFYLRSDDNSQLFLNPNGPDAAGRLLILEETGCCGDWNKFQSAAFPLVAGQAYYLEMLYKEGGGGDYGKVAARMDGTGYPTLGTANTAIDPASLAGPAIGYPYAPADVGGALTLAGPSSVTVQANHTASFSVAVINPGGWPMSYQWRRNGSPISDATDSSYTLAPTAADNNARFTVQVFTLGSAVVSAEATLTVTAATSPPAVAAVQGSTALNQLIVSFNELLAVPATSSFSVPGFTTLSAVLDSTGTSVILTFAPPLLPGQTYTLSVLNVQDSSGNTLASATVPVRTFFFSRGLLKYDYFGGLTLSAGTVSDVTGDPRYPNNPDWTAFIPGYDSRLIFPDDSHTGYGDHITGFFVPPTNGNYIFYIKSDDASQFLFNPNGSDPAGSTFQMEETGANHPFSTNPSQALALTNGQLYYMESVHKEGGGGDYVQVAAKLDSDPADPDSLLPIPPSMVGILADPVGASVTIMQQPPNAVGVYLAAPLNASFDANDGGFKTFNYGVPAGPWWYNSAAGSWTNHGPPNCGGPFATGLKTPVLTIRSNDPVVVTFAHRWSFEADANAAYDGGQVRLSVNGGPFATVPGASFSANGYNGTIGGSIIGVITGTPGWVNEAFVTNSAGYETRTFLTSVATLGTFSPGDQIQLEFLASWDECSEGTEPNWEIDSVRVSGGNAVLSAEVSLTVGAESTYRGLPNPYLSYFWQRYTGGSFVDIPGPSSATYMLNAGLGDSGAQFRCIVYGPGAVATSAVATVTVTLPLYVARTGPATLTLSWPLPPPPFPPTTTFLLEKSGTMLPGSWTTVPSSQYQTAANSVYLPVTIAPADLPTFYRLRRN